MRCKGVFALAALQLPLARGSQCERFHPTDALLVIDVQNCFIDERPVRSETPASPLLAEWTTTIPAGSLQVPGAAGIVDVINEWVDFASSGQVYATLDYHPPGHCSFCHTQVGDGIVPGTYCITGTASSPLVFSEDFNASHRCRDPISELDWLAAKYFQVASHLPLTSPHLHLHLTSPYLTPIHLTSPRLTTPVPGALRRRHARREARPVPPARCQRHRRQAGARADARRLLRLQRRPRLGRARRHPRPPALHARPARARDGRRAGRDAGGARREAALRGGPRR